MAADAVTTESVPSEVSTTAHQLGEAIASMPAYQSYLDARAAVAEDAELQTRIEGFEERRDAFLQDRRAGDATQDDVAALRQAQRDLHSDPTMSRYLEAKERLQNRLESVNAAISEPLEIDFGVEAGGCCQD